MPPAPPPASKKRITASTAEDRIATTTSKIWVATNIETGRIGQAGRVVADIGVEIERLRIVQVTEKNTGRIGRHKPARAISIMTGLGVIETSLGIPLIPRELVGGEGSSRDLLAVRQIVHFVRYASQIITYRARGT